MEVTTGLFIDDVPHSSVRIVDRDIVVLYFFVLGTVYVYIYFFLISTLKQGRREGGFALRSPPPNANHSRQTHSVSHTFDSRIRDGCVMYVNV